MKDAEFEAILNDQLNSHCTHTYLVKLEGVWKWRNYSTFDTNFGWCIYPADEAAKESLKKASRFECSAFATVQKANGQAEEIMVPMRVFEGKDLFWFEYGKKTRKQAEKDFARDCKLFKETRKLKIVEASEIPLKWQA